MSDLLNHQKLFMKMLGQLLLWIDTNGYEVVGEELKRSQAQANANAASGAGIKNSLHLQKLAIDLSIFKNGKFLQEVSEIEPIGVYWESLGGTWGGRFTTRPDADHFSLAFGGVK